jgi:DNA-binding TFAR19-related protein (PDSD5 family)
MSDDVAASEIPDGFTFADPTGAASAAAAQGQASGAAAQREAQRQAILEQAMTPDALARLRRVKVSTRNMTFDI